MWLLQTLRLFLGNGFEDPGCDGEAPIRSIVAIRRVTAGDEAGREVRCQRQHRSRASGSREPSAAVT